jgi:hypothetical protein
MYIAHVGLVKEGTRNERAFNLHLFSLSLSLSIQQVCFSLVAHWLACIWYVVAEKERQYSDQEFDVGKFSSCPQK